MSDTARVLADLGQLATDTFHAYCADPGMHGEAAGIGLILGHLHTMSGGEHGLPPDEVVATQRRATPAATCRRITDPEPTPFAVPSTLRRTCIEMLAAGYHHANDMCPACTRELMAALDPDGSLKWHEGYLARAAEGVAR